MATIKDLPDELLYIIIFLLVQSSGGAEDFARILSVCRKFLLFAEDKNVLRLVHFDIKLEFKNFYRYQHVNSLLVKCSEAGNVAAQFLLGKVILVSSSQLLLGEWQEVGGHVHPCDFARLSDLRCILATKVHAQNLEVDAFMTNFLPKPETRLAHRQLVKRFLLNASPHDFIEMGVFLKGYVRYFTKVIYSDPFHYTRELVSKAHLVNTIERVAKSKESFIEAYMGWSNFLKSGGKSGKDIYDNRKEAEAEFLLQLLHLRCLTVGVHWQEAISDVDFLEELWRNDANDKFDEAYVDFIETRKNTFISFELDIYRS